ncbi:ABC transporter permease [Microbacterium aquimaris]|uniref:ABC transporter permease n=1 Tax=Microbacterium aquimaris TaxID=459816 RepID=A0ABU5N5C9_9MICO|nr:ABC transporter permease [Microbacterium aquimaris]MDZ8161274.1 ABC transporter permease [Microbacterium aquimaris]
MWGAVVGFFRSQRWWILRLVALPFQLLTFAVVVFFLVRLIPGDPVLTVTGNQATDEVYARVQEQMGLSGTIWDQLVAYVSSLARLDLGVSLLTQRALADEFSARLPATLELAALGLVVAVVLVLIASYFTVFRPVRVLAPMVKAYSRAAGAIPDFAVGVLAIFLFYATLQWAPAPLGRLDPFISSPPQVTGFPLLDVVLSGDAEATGSMLAHLALPIAVLVIAHSAVLLRILVAQLDAELVRPATLFRVSTGASPGAVVASVYRRALPPVVTMVGTTFGYLVGGAVIVESLFSFGGMGQYLTEALAGADLTAMQGFLVVIAAVSLVVFLLVDIINMLLDPRRRPGTTEVS